MSSKREPKWQPITMLEKFVPILRDLREGTAAQVENLNNALERPGLLRQSEIENIVRVHRDSLESLSLYDEQCALWKEEPLSEHSSEMLDQLLEWLPEIRRDTKKVLGLADRLASGRRIFP